MNAIKGKVEKYTIDLLDIPQETAEILVSLLRCIGGRPDGPRGHTDAVMDALVEAGVAEQEPKEYHLWAAGDHSLYFGKEYARGR